MDDSNYEEKGWLQQQKKMGDSLRTTKKALKKKLILVRTLYKIQKYKKKKFLYWSLIIDLFIKRNKQINKNFIISKGFEGFQKFLRNKNKK